MKKKCKRAHSKKDLLTTGLYGVTAGNVWRLIYIVIKFKAFEKTLANAFQRMCLSVGPNFGGGALR